MYTTSRYASEGTRKLARKMAAGAGEPYIARGKHTIAQLAGIARKRGERLISILRESQGKASGIAVIELDETGSWKWIKVIKA